MLIILVMKHFWRLSYTNKCLKNTPQTWKMVHSLWHEYCDIIPSRVILSEWVWIVGWMRMIWMKDSHKTYFIHRNPLRSIFLKRRWNCSSWATLSFLYSSYPHITSQSFHRTLSYTTLWDFMGRKGNKTWRRSYRILDLRDKMRISTDSIYKWYPHTL